MLYLFGSVIFTTWLTVCFKIAERFQINAFQAIVANYFVCIITGSVLDTNPFSGTQILGQPWLPWAVVLGCCFITFYNLTAITVRWAGVSIAGVATKISLVVPFLFALFFLQESASWLKWVGIAIAMVSVVFLSLPPQKQYRKKTPHAFVVFLLPLVLFLGTGFQDTVIKWTELKYVAPVQLNVFLVCCFIVAFSVGFLIFLGLLLSKQILFQPKAVIAGVAIGIPNYFSIWFLIKALKAFPLHSSVILPVNNIGILLLNVLVGYFIFKERLSGNNLIGILLATLAIVLISSNFI